MRTMKLALITLVALLLGCASASAITVKKRIEAPGLPPEIWAVVGDFCAIKKWHPAVADCVETKEGDDTFRTLTLKDGGKIKEKLTGTEDVGYTYEIVESPLPVKNYKSKLWLEVDDEPDRSVIFWQSDFDANGASDDEAKAKITSILADGVKGIKQQAIAAHDAKEAAAGKAPQGDKDNDDDK
jgi:Polyketide cyclase / dehydrase and lipid transport